MSTFYRDGRELEYPNYSEVQDIVYGGATGPTANSSTESTSLGQGSFQSWHHPEAPTVAPSDYYNSTYYPLYNYDASQPRLPCFPSNSFQGTSSIAHIPPTPTYYGRYRSDYHGMQTSFTPPPPSRAHYSTPHKTGDAHHSSTVTNYNDGNQLRYQCPPPPSSSAVMQLQPRTFPAVDPVVDPGVPPSNRISPSTYRPPQVQPTANTQVPRVCECQWLNDDGTVCGRQVCSLTVPKHLATHGIKKMAHNHPIACRWKECPGNKRTITRGNMVRHVREMHLECPREVTSSGASAFCVSESQLRSCDVHLQVDLDVKNTLRTGFWRVSILPNSTLDRLYRASSKSRGN